MLSFSSLFGLRSGIIILFRSVCGDVTLVKSILLLFNRNSIPPVALAVGNVIGFFCSLLIIFSLDFWFIRGLIIVSVRIIGIGEKCGDGSFFINNELLRSFSNSIGVEKLVLIVKGWDVKRDFRFVSFVVYKNKLILFF